MKDISRYVPSKLQCLDTLSLSLSLSVSFLLLLARRPGRNGTQYIKNLTLQTLLFDV